MKYGKIGSIPPSKMHQTLLELLLKGCQLSLN
jgi:hypothetical protein